MTLPVTRIFLPHASKFAKEFPSRGLVDFPAAEADFHQSALELANHIPRQRRTKAVLAAREVALELAALLVWRKWEPSQDHWVSWEPKP